MPYDTESFHPTLETTPAPGYITEEQWYHIERVLKYSCSDNQFATKALEAIKYIISLTPVTVP